MPNPNDKDNKLIVELKPCARCSNPFMVKRGQLQQGQELICDNCIKMEQKKRELSIGVLDDVIESQKIMEKSINEMKNNLTVSKGQFNKQTFIEQIKKRSQSLMQSIELLQKIDDSNDEKYIDQYKKLFDQIKKNNK